MKSQSKTYGVSEPQRHTAVEDMLILYETVVPLWRILGAVLAGRLAA
jgi:hypothetical protein